MNRLLPKSDLDYDLWRVGASRCEFRGPEVDLGAPYLAVLGGSEAYGKFVEQPFPHLLAERLEAPVVNLGLMNAGLALVQNEASVLDVAVQADVTVVQVLGAQNMSNCFYSVHPRRNDRFIAASPRLKALYPQVDFTGFHFTGHLIQTLEDIDPWAFSTVLEELRVAWVENMLAVLGSIPGQSVLLWMSERSPDDPGRGSVAADPAFVDREMLRELEGHHAGLVEVVASDAARQEGVQGMCHKPDDAAIARMLPGPLFHAEVAAALEPAVRAAQKKRRAGNADAPPKESGPLRVSREAPGRR